MWKVTCASISQTDFLYLRSPSRSEWMDIGLKFLKRRLRLAGNYYNDFFVVNEFLVDRIA